MIQIGGAAVLLVAVIAGAWTLGRESAPAVVEQSPSLSPALAGPGGRVIEAVHGDIRMAVGITPAAGWVRLALDSAGLPERVKCTLIVVTRDGQRVPAATWITPSPDAPAGPPVFGSVAVDGQVLAGVAVEDSAGNVLAFADMD